MSAGFMAGMQMANAGVKVLTGFSDLVESTSSTKKHLMDTRARIKKTQLHEQFIKNYARTLNQYALGRSDLLEQKSKASSNINTQSAVLAAQSAIDINESSFRSTQIGKLDEEFSKGINNLIDTNRLNLLALASNEQLGIATVNNNLSKAHQDINAQRAGEVAQGALNMLGGLGEAYEVKESFGTKPSGNNTTKSSWFNF